MIKVGVFFGGKSVEHEISVITMNQAINSLNPEKYEIIPIYIAKDGVMYTGDDLLDLYSFRDMEVLLKRCYKVAVVNTGKEVQVVRCPAPIIGKRVLNTIDVAFPIVHGTNCEDGTVAGSVLHLNRGVWNVFKNSSIPLWECVNGASLNPATVLGLEKTKGSIEVGKDADVIITDDNFEVTKTIIGGEIKYEA